jgi:PIN domain nuclease of toxin-antitoxin system
VKFLVDSNAFIWAYVQPTELSAAAHQAISDSANERFISIASIWEIAIKTSTGKLAMPPDPSAALSDLALTLLPISLAHTQRIPTLPFHHRDPFDRMMIAQAIEEGLTIVTRDRIFAAYGVPVLTA